jgi:hypothetical protein
LQRECGMSDDTKIGKALDLAEPPESPRFFYELQARISEHDRKALLRWRRGGAVVIALAAAAVAAVAVLAATNGAAANKVIDRTFSCRAGTDPRGLPQIGVNGSVALGKSTGASSGAGWTELSTPAAEGAPKPWIDFLYLAGDKTGAVVGSSLCHSVRTPLGLKAPRLPQDAVFTKTYLGGFDWTCSVNARIVFRARVLFDSAGKPRWAALAVRNETKGKPAGAVAYVTWTAKKMHGSAADSCS